MDITPMIWHMKTKETNNKERKKKKKSLCQYSGRGKGHPAYKRDYGKNKKSIPKSNGKWKGKD